MFSFTFRTEASDAAFQIGHGDAIGKVLGFLSLLVPCLLLLGPLLNEAHSEAGCKGGPTMEITAVLKRKPILEMILAAMGQEW